MNQIVLSMMGAKKTGDGWKREWEAAKAELSALAQAPPADHLLLTTPRTLPKDATAVILREGGW